jgi:hypothetical protein
MLQLRQFDVTSAFLCRRFLEEVYMHQPVGFDDGSARVCKLKRSLYGLKQVPRCWNQRFVDFMKKRRLKISTAGPCLFVCQRKGKKLTVACVWMTAWSRDWWSEIDVFIDQLRPKFKITRGTFSNFLGMKTERLQDGIFVCHRVNTGKVLERFKMHGANSVATE